MKKYIVVVLLLVTMDAFCQTGINTLSPQQALHVSGTPSTTTVIGTTGKNVVTPTIRLEGLNQTNNTLHPASPSVSTLPMYATSNGDLVLGKRTQILYQSLPSNDAVPLFPQTAVLANVSTTVKTITFTLDRTALVCINAMVSISGMNPPSSSTPIIDGMARRMGVQLMFSQAPAASGMPVNVPFAENSSSYTNGAAPSSVSGGITLDGLYLYNLGKAIKLTAGTYTLNILGVAYYDGTPYQVKFGEAPYDSMNVIAIML